MDTQGRGNEQEPEAQKPLTPAERRDRQIVEMTSVQLPTQASGGERLLPYLSILIETCWIAVLLTGIAMLQFSPSHTPLLPLWSPFVIMAGAYWFTTQLEQRDLKRESNSPKIGASWLYALLVVAILILIWASVYASSAFVLDPRWLGAMFNDLLLLNGNAIYVAFVCMMTLFFCWRGIRLARRVIEPAHIFRSLSIGAGITLAVIFFLSVGHVNPAQVSVLLFIIPLFVATGLIAHALARAAFLRRAHPVGLQGNVTAQERALFNITLIIGLAFIVLTLLLGTFASPDTLSALQKALAPLGYAYDWLVGVFAQVVTFLLTPLFWLFTQLHLQTRLPQIPLAKGVTKPIQRPLSKTPPAVVAAIPLIKVILPLLIGAVIIALIVVALRRRRVRLIHRDEDVHESLWSWSLFWTQIKALLRGLWLRFFPRRANTSATAQMSVLTGEPGTRTIREIYRALLSWASAHGYPRKRNETPYEFQNRLETQMPFIEDELDAVTAAYTRVRYGETVPDESEIYQIRTSWQALQQKQRDLSKSDSR